MANIIWSFGIALSAQDQATGPITDVITSLNTMEKSLGALNQSQLSNAQTVKDLTEAYRQLNAELGVFSGIDQAAAIGSNAKSAIGDVAGSIGGAVEEGGELALEGVEAFVSGGVTLVIGGVTKLVKGSVSVIGSIASGLFSAVTTILSTAATIVSKVVSTTVSLAWSLTKGVAGAIEGIVLSPFRLIKTLLNTDLMSRASKGIEDFLSLGDAFGPVDQSLRQLTAQMGGTAGQANKLIDTVVNMGISTGISVEHLRDLAVALGKTGQNLSDIRPDTAKVLGHLSDTFGLGADETIRFSSAARRVGVDIKELAGTAVTFGEKFGIPNLMSIMPGLTNMAAEAITRFSKNVVGSQKQLIETTLKTSAIYAKAFGKDIGEATRLAQATFEGFAGAAQQNSDLMLGLADSLSPLSMALLQGGANFGEMNQIIAEGSQEPLVAAAHMRQLIDSMTPGPAQERFKRLLQKELPEGMKQLVFDNDVYTRGLKQQAFAQAANTEAITSGTKNFDAMTDAMRDNFSSLRLVADNVITAIKSLFGAIFTDTMRTSMKEVVGNFENFGKRIGELVSEIKGSAVFQKIQKSFGEIAGYLITAGKGADLFKTALSGLTAAGGILAPIASGLEGISGILQGSLIGGTLSLTALFGGLGRSLIKTLTTSILNEKGTLRVAMEDLFNSARDKVREVLAGWDRDFPNDLDATFAKAGRTVGNKLGEIAKTISDFVRGLFDAKQRGEVIDRLKGMFATTEGEKGSIASSLTSITKKAFSAVKEFLTNFSDGVLAPFGTNTTLFFESLKLGFKDFILAVRGYWITFKDIFISTYAAVQPIMKGLLEGVLTVSGGLLSAVGKMQQLVGNKNIKELEKYKKEAMAKRQDMEEELAGLAEKRQWTSGGEDTEKLDARARNLKVWIQSKNEAIQLFDKSILKSEMEANTYNDMAEKIEETKRNLTTGASLIDVVQAKTDSVEAQKILKQDLSDQVSARKEYAGKLSKFQSEEAAKALEREKHQAEQDKSSQDGLNKSLDTGNQLRKETDEKVSKKTPDDTSATEPATKDDIRSNYQKMLGVTDKATADAWMETWMRDGFDPNSMPGIPEAGGAGGTPPAKPSAPSPLNAPSKMATPPPEQGEEGLPAIKEMLAQMIIKQNQPVDVRFSYDGPTTQHLVRVSMNGENAQLG